MSATASINLELPYDTHSDYHNGWLPSLVTVYPTSGTLGQAKQKVHNILVQLKDDRTDKLP
jgi:hypothetical protein